MLQQLLLVQDVDRRLVQLRRQKKEIPERMAVIEARLNAHRESLKAAQDEMKKLAAAMKQIDIEIESSKQKIQRFREQEMQIKSNEEYRALEHEIAVVQKQIRSLEDQEIEMMEKTEELRRLTLERENDLRLEEKRVAEDQAMLKQHADAIEKEMAELEKKRNDLIQAVDPAWRNRYEKVLRRWGDFAVVPVENGTCGGCHMKLTPQMVHDARKSEAMVACSYCNRLLYVAQ